jgi:hypothetical protein
VRVCLLAAHERTLMVYNSPGRVGGPSDHPTLALTPSTLFGPVSPGSASM